MHTPRDALVFVESLTTDQRRALCTELGLNQNCPSREAAARLADTFSFVRSARSALTLAMRIGAWVDR